ncbi:MAG: hypothetical protein ABIP35_17190 [Ginsengibacter sp.]
MRLRDVTIKIDAEKVLTKIPTSVYGHNANIYMSPMVGEPDNGTFSAKIFVNGKGLYGSIGGPFGYTLLKANVANCSGGIKIKLPPHSAVFINTDKK